ncbi:MAG: hypothetical protein QM541_02405 [Flavobacterium sp.]|nr:hypothetical protein [Flavobacterium sp.]
MKKITLIFIFISVYNILYSQVDSSELVYIYFQKIDTVKFNCNVFENKKGNTFLFKFSLKHPKADTANNFTFSFEIDTVNSDKSDSRLWHMWDYDVFLIPEIYSFDKENIKKTIKRYPAFFVTDYFGELRRYKIIKVETLYDSNAVTTHHSN